MRILLVNETRNTAWTTKFSTFNNCYVRFCAGIAEALAELNKDFEWDVVLYDILSKNDENIGIELAIIAAKNNVKFIAKGSIFLTNITSLNQLEKSILGPDRPPHLCPECEGKVNYCHSCNNYISRWDDLGKLVRRYFQS